MCPQDQSKPEQANKSTQTSPDSSSKWGQVTVGSFLPPWPTWNSLNSLACVDHKAMCDEVEQLHQVCGEGPLYTLFYLTNKPANQNRRTKSRVLSEGANTGRGAGSSTRRTSRKCYQGSKSRQKREPNPHGQDSKPTSWY